MINRIVAVLFVLNITLQNIRFKLNSCSIVSNNSLDIIILPHRIKLTLTTELIIKKAAFLSSVAN